MISFLCQIDLIIWWSSHDIIGPENSILIADREHGKLHVYDIIEKKETNVYEKDQIGPEIYASYYSKFDANIYLGKTPRLVVYSFYSGEL